MVTVTDSDGNEIQKSVFIDDQGNVIDESDIDYITESYVDEHGFKQQKQVPKIKDESLKRMQKEPLKMPTHKVLKDVIEYDDFGNKKIVEKLVDEVGPKKVPYSNNLKPTVITTTDSEGNKIQKSIFIDDQGNVIEE